MSYQANLETHFFWKVLLYNEYILTYKQLLDL